MMNFIKELTIEQAQYLSKFPPNQNFNPNAQNYNPGWISHPNFSWKNSNTRKSTVQMKPSPPPLEKKSSLYVKLVQLADMQIERERSQHQFESEMRTSLTNQETQLMNLEVKMGQMASLLNERQNSDLSSTSEVN